MILKKKFFYLITFSIILTLYISGIFTGFLSRSEKREYIFQTGFPNPEIYPVNANHLDLPLPKPSLITTEVEKIRLDLEKISINKFFIVYSEIYGNQSHTAYHLYLTNLDRKNIDKEAIGEIYLKTATGDTIKPVAQLPVIQDFPVDQPLGWKIKIIVKFPYKTVRPVHELVLKYQNKEFKLTGIYY